MIVYLFDELSARARAMRAEAYRTYETGDLAGYQQLSKRARKLENSASRCRSAGVVPVRSQTSFAIPPDGAA